MRFHSSSFARPGALIAVALLAAGCGGGGGGGGSASVAPGITAGGSFTNVAPMTKARVYHSATLLGDGRILIAGGLVGPSAGTADVEILDPTTGTITSAAPMSAARLQHSAVLLPTKKVLVIGGQSDRFGAALRSTELYDPATNRWTAGPQLVEGRAGAAVALYESGKKVLIAGGFSWTGNQPVVSRTAEIYSADSNTVAATTGQMQSARCAGKAITQGNGQILLASGYSSVASGTPAQSEIYDIRNDTFVAVAMSDVRADAVVAAIDSGAIYGIGGVTSAAVTLSSAEQFDGQSWSRGSAAKVARAQAAAGVIGAEVVIIGGKNGAQVLGSVEQYPSGVAPVSSLADPRFAHTATVVGDRVYLIGGFTTNDEILASIEVYSSNTAAVPGAGGAKGVRANGTATPPPAAGLGVTTLNPANGAAGITVEIVGAGFDAVAANNTVRFNGLQAVVSSVDVTVPQAHKLRVVVPVGVTTGAVTVEVNHVLATGPVFTVGGAAAATGPAPRVLFVLPNSARSFIPVSITGQDFGTQPFVTFNGVPTITIVSLSTKTLPIIGSVSELICLVPPGATSGALVVHNGAQQSNPFYFTVQ
jgi:hypothetical protein